MTDRLSKEQIDFYQENGFVQVDDVLSADELQEFRQYIEEAMQEENQNAIKNNAQNGSYYRVLNQKVNTWRDHGGMARYAFHPRFAQMARQLTGADGIRFFHDHALWKMPGDSKPTPWHQDLPYWPMDQDKALSIWIALDDVDENNGCMMFVPKSQTVGKLKGIDLVNPQDIFQFTKGTFVEEQRPVIVRMKAGSCTFHSGLTFHYAHANNTANPRRAFAIIFMPDGTVYNGQRHVVTDDCALTPGQPFAGGRFPRLA